METRNQITRPKIFNDPYEIWHSLPYQQWDTIYNKLRLVYKQGLECAPVAKTFVPNKYPVILKPIISIAENQQKYRVCMNAIDYKKLAASEQFVGWFWMPYLDTEKQSCLELIIYNGRPVFGYSLDYQANPDMPGTLNQISLNISASAKLIQANIPGWEQVMSSALKNYTGALSIYYIGSYIISAAARWTIWSEYIFNEPSLMPVLDQICRVVNTYTQNLEQDTTGVCLELLRQGLGHQIIGLVPLYLKSSNDFSLVHKHWLTISNSLGVSINWLPLIDKQSQLVAVLTIYTPEQLRKINKYKQISQLASAEQNIPVVY